MTNALISGITGQDGAYLAKFLVNKGYTVYGTYRRISTPNFWRLRYVNVYDKINLVPIELSDTGSIIEAIKISDPDEIYHLAAQSFVGASFTTPIATGDITGLSVARFLEAVRIAKNNAKFYFASTSEMFGDELINGALVLNEQSIFNPRSPYAAAKLYGYWMTHIYRNSYDIFAVNGILFNHESPLRGLEFVTRKIVNEVAKISLNLSEELLLGNLDSKRDWGFAPDYVEAMWKMMQKSEPSEYVISTGESHSVKEFVEEAFNHVGLDWQNYVKVDARFLRPLDVTDLRGDSSKAHEELNWHPKVKFNKLIKIMLDEEISRWQRWVSGETFPWDAINYPSENNIIRSGQIDD